MAAKKKEVLPKVAADTEQTSVITYANEVLTTIASTAMAEVEGIAEMLAVPSSLLGKKNTGTAKGIKIEQSEDTVNVDLYISVEYGTPIQQCAANAQEAVKHALENMTGMKVVCVNVHVQGVSFEKDKGLNEAGKTVGLTEGELASKKSAKKAKKAEPEADKAEKPEKAEKTEKTETEEKAPSVEAENAE